MGKKKYGRRFLAVMLVIAMILVISGCGKGGEESPESTDRNTSGPQEAQEAQEDLGPIWTYTVETPDLGEKEWMTDSRMYMSDSSVKLVGDYLYYKIGNDWDEETDSYGYRFYRYSLLEGTAERLTRIIHDPSGMNGKYDVGDDGSFYVAYFVSTSINGTRTEEMQLMKYDPAGEEIYRFDFAEAMGITSTEEIGNAVSVLSNSDGGVCLVCQKKLFFFDGEGNCIGNMAPDGEGQNYDISSAGKTENGTICINLQIWSAQTRSILQEVNFANRTFRTVAENFQHFGPLCVGVKQAFLLNDTGDSTVYDFDPETQTKEALFCWKDYGYQMPIVQSMGVTSDERIAVVLFSDETVLLFTRTLAEKKEEIVLGTVIPTTVLRDTVSKFNRSSDKYHITVKDYSAGRASSVQEVEEAWTRLKLDLVSGNGPDIIDMLDKQIRMYAEQGLVEDLTPWLEKSSVIGREDFVGHVLEGVTFDGILVALPKQIMVETVTGRVSDVGTDAGWTMEEFRNLAEQNPGKQILRYPGKEELLDFCLRANLDEFVQWETGKCSFDSSEFVQILEFVNRYGDVTAAGETDTTGSYYEKIQRGEILLSRNSIYSFDWNQYLNEIFEGEACTVGYPSVDGREAHFISLNGMCGITAGSRHKEGAWEFLEFYVTLGNLRNMYALPAVKSVLEEQILEELEDVAYEVDESFEIILDENGQPIPKSKITHWEDKGDGWVFEYHTITREEADRTMEILSVARVESAENAVIRGIIDEEVGTFFYGSKSASQVADVIQNRVQTYLYER